MSNKADLQTELSILDILVYGQPVLQQKAQEIADINEEVLNIAQHMVFTMHSAPGLGLAAPQVNQSIRLITVDQSVGEKSEDLFILINPKIIEREGACSLEEGCLSLPEINENVSRPERILLKGYDLNGKELSLEAEGLLARIFCHEVDHLDGKLLLDHLSPLKQNLLRKKLLKRFESQKH